MLQHCRMPLLAISLIAVLMPFYAPCMANPNCEGKNAILCQTQKANERIKSFLYNTNYAQKLFKRSSHSQENENYDEPPEKSFIDKVLVVPTIIGHFLGTYPMRIPGLPYHIDKGSPDRYPYRPYSTFYLGEGDEYR